MMYKIKLFVLPMLFLLALPAASHSATNAMPFQANGKLGPIILEIVINGIHELSWPPMSGSTPYTVTVVNLNTNALFTQVTTSGTSTLLYGLTPGETYLFSVRRGTSVVSLEATI